MYSKSIFIVLAVISTLSSCQTDSKKNITLPNILFIMADDHATGSISSYGSQLIQTPGIDRLAKEGMKFTNCFNVNSLCAPSRAALLTGKHSSLNGFFRIGDTLDVRQSTFPKYLQRAGYQTAIIGKWHIVSEPQGFDYYNVLPGHGKYFDGRLKRKGLPWQDGDKGGIIHEGYLTDVITDLAIEWIDKNNSEKPFFLMVQHKAPHTPHDYPEKYSNLFQNEELPFPKTYTDTYHDKNPGLKFGECRTSRLDKISLPHIKEAPPEGMNKKEFKDWAYQAFFKGYLRLVASLDDNINRLLDYIDESGLSKNTIVIYTSDNGFFHGEHGLFNKMWMYEESLKLPLLIRYPGVIEAGSQNDKMVSILDFAPTFLEFAGAQISSEFQGKSIKPLLLNKKNNNWRNAMFYNYFEDYGVPNHYGIRTSKYKLIHFTEPEGNIFGELYDLKSDPDEMVNLYYKSEFEVEKKELEKILTEMKIEAGNDM